MTIRDRVGNTPENLAFKAPCHVATTANIALAGLQTIDGVTVSENDRVLVKNQTNQTQNGIYQASSGNWTRPHDADNNEAFIQGTQVYVTSGTANGNADFVLQCADDPVIIGTSLLVWVVQVSSASVPASRTISTTAPLTGGGDLSANRTLALSYSATFTLDGSNNLEVATNAIGNTKLRQGTALSVIGNATNATANVADIAAASDFQVLRRSGTAIGFGSVDLSQSGAVGSSILLGANGGTGIANTGKTITIGGSVVFSGAFVATITVTATTNATLPAGTHTLAGLDVAQTWSATQQFNDGNFALKGSTSGTLTQKAAAVAGTNTITWPAGTTDFSATGGTSQVVKQTSAGGALTVAQLAASDLSNTTTGSGAVVLATSPTLVTPTLGAAIGTSLALGGATLGGNALAVTGTALFNSAVTLSAAITYGGVTLSNSVTGTGSMVLSASPTFTGTVTAAALASTSHIITSASASALAVGLNGATNPALQVDASTASSATGLKVKSAAAAGGLALSVITSGTNENLTVDAAGSGTITLGGTSTGAITLTRATTLSAALTYGGVTLSNAVTGTGNMVLSASPTLTGTITAAAANFSGTITFGTGTITALTNKASPHATDDYVIIYDAAGTAIKKATVGSVGSSGAVSSIAGNTGAFTLSGGITNSTNDIRLSNMTDATIKGRALGAGTGAPSDLTATEAAAIVGSVGGALKSKVAKFTRDLSTASGSQSITGVGFRPTSVIFFAAINGAQPTSMSLIDSSLTGGGWNSQGTFATGIDVFDDFAIQMITDTGATNIQQATVSSYDSDGFTLSWTKTGSPTGTATIKALCFR